MVRFIYIASIVLLIALAGWLLYPKMKGMFTPPVGAEQIDATYRAFLSENGLTDPIPDVGIVITKDNRMLYLMSGDTSVARWRCSLGRNPEGAKMMADDNRTPEGEYVIVERDDDTNFHLNLVINYPARHDADAGRREEIIDDRELRDIYRYVTQGRLPSQDTELGGGIGIHGGGTFGDWTRGSIAVEDDVIEILWAACPNGTSVTILPEFLAWDLSPHMLATE